MKAHSRKFSTGRGILWVGVFFTLLLLFPLVTERKSFEFKLNPNETSSPEAFPLEAKLIVLRDNAPNKRASRSRVSLQDLIRDAKGPILINFWATWCPPCLEELPSLEMLNQQILSKEANTTAATPRLITISVDDRMEDISKLESTLDFKPSFSVMHDREGELARSMGTTKFPETYLVNSQGKVLYKWLGPQDWLSHDVLQQLKIHAR